MTTWHSACTSSAGCVEISRDGTHALVRDSKDSAGPVLAFTAEEWRGFIGAVKAGDFDWTVDAAEVQA